MAAQYLIVVLCPPLKLQDILSPVSSGPFCGNVDGALMFRVNSPGPTVSKCTQRLASRISENTVITVSLGKVPRMGFSLIGHSVLSEIPNVETPSSQSHYGGKEENNSKHTTEPNGIVIREHVLEFLLTMNHSKEANNPMPTRVSNLLVHIVDTHVDHL